MRIKFDSFFLRNASYFLLFVFLLLLIDLFVKHRKVSVVVDARNAIIQIQKITPDQTGIEKGILVVVPSEGLGLCSLVMMKSGFFMKPIQSTDQFFLLASTADGASQPYLLDIQEEDVRRNPDYPIITFDIMSIVVRSNITIPDSVWRGSVCYDDLEAGTVAQLDEMSAILGLSHLSKEESTKVMIDSMHNTFFDEYWDIRKGRSFVGEIFATIKWLVLPSRK